MKPHPARLGSETIVPDPSSFNPKTLATGQPSCPGGFTWRNQHFSVQAVLETWKESGPEGGNPGNDRYVRRHYFVVQCLSGEVMTLYCSRFTNRRLRKKALWTLYTISPESQTAIPD